MNDMNKRDVLDRLAGARAALLTAVEGLSETEMITLLVAGKWTLRDILAHVGGWATWDLAGIKSILAGESPGFAAIRDVDAFNARLVDERRGWSLDRILAEMGDTQAALQELLTGLPNADLFRAGPFQGPYWDNLAGWLRVAWEHEEEHVTQIRDWRAMRSLGRRLKGDPIPWLLEMDNPSVRYWTLVDVLGRSAADAEVREARAAIAQQLLVQGLFARQHPDGHWGDDATKPYTAEGTLGVLALLHMLGVEPDERTSAGCDSFLRFCQHESGGFSLRKTQRSGVFPCTTGEHLPFLVYFGLGDDERVRRAFAFVVEDMSTEDALDCGRYQHRDCLWGAIAALNGLAVLPANMRSPQSEQVVQRLADALLDADYDFDDEHKRWLSFGVPRTWDLLSALRALAVHGYGGDPRFAPLFDRFLIRQDEQGRWVCGSASRTWPLEKRNRPSKWITLDALRLLRTIAKE